MSKAIDLTGMRFGRLTVLYRNDLLTRNGKHGHVYYWHCKCDCGNEKDILKASLTSGNTKSCGCLHNELLSQARLKDITGQRFGKLVVIERAKNRGKETFWKCKCDCGNIKDINASKLKNGTTKSCGCLVKYSPNKHYTRKNPHKTHGKTNTRIYRIYRKMIRRCCNPNEPSYKDYGGRGIAICKDWLDDFMNFYDWAVVNDYKDDLSIDRINNNGNYEPSNCRWATKKEQANNTRKTIFLTYKGETKPASEWAEITGIKKDTITMRKRSGWSDEKIIETPMRVFKKRK
jgi:hypothetical protein